NGTIEVKSNEGKGTSFSFVIPFKQKDISVNEQYPVFSNNFSRDEEMELIEHANSSPEQDEEIGLNSSNKPRILVVEDNADVRIYIKTLLHNEFEISEAVNGQEGFLK